MGENGRGYIVEIWWNIFKMRILKLKLPNCKMITRTQNLWYDCSRSIETFGIEQYLKSRNKRKKLRSYFNS